MHKINSRLFAIRSAQKRVFYILYIISLSRFTIPNILYFSVPLYFYPRLCYNTFTGVLYAFAAPPVLRSAPVFGIYR